MLPNRSAGAGGFEAIVAWGLEPEFYGLNPAWYVGKSYNLGGVLPSSSFLIAGMK